MDFKLVFKNLLSAFKEQKITYALIGGLALGAWGVPRGTVDIDFLVQSDDMVRVDAIMKHLGYECKYKTDNVSQYLSPLNIFGEVDFLHAFRTYSIEVLQRAEERKLFKQSLSVKVVQIEDLIGFKLQAMANNESRKALDLADIDHLISLHQDTIDWDQMETYFDLFDFKKLYDELRNRYGQAD